MFRIDLAMRFIGNLINAFKLYEFKETIAYNEDIFQKTKDVTKFFIAKSIYLTNFMAKSIPLVDV